MTRRPRISLLPEEHKPSEWESFNQTLTFIICLAGPPLMLAWLVLMILIKDPSASHSVKVAYQLVSALSWVMLLIVYGNLAYLFGALITLTVKDAAKDVRQGRGTLMHRLLQSAGRVPMVLFLLLFFLIMLSPLIPVLQSITGSEESAWLNIVYWSLVIAAAALTAGPGIVRVVLVLACIVLEALAPKEVQAGNAPCSTCTRREGDTLKDIGRTVVEAVLNGVGGGLIVGIPLWIILWLVIPFAIASDIALKIGTGAGLYCAFTRMRGR